jgi:hypothetical protein
MFHLNSGRMGALAVMLACLLALQETGFFVAEALAQAQGNLRIVVLEGEGARNDLALRTAQRLAVQVQDTVAGTAVGAEVTFTAPATGAGGVFSNGARRITVMTNAQGLAVVEGFRPNAAAGDFQIGIEASYRGQKATASIMQSNIGAAKKSGSAKWIAIIGIAGGAAAAAALAGKKGGDSPTPLLTPGRQIRHLRFKLLPARQRRVLRDSAAYPKAPEEK